MRAWIIIALPTTCTAHAALKEKDTVTPQAGLGKD
jgi:hypothetical protein